MSDLKRCIEKTTFEDLGISPWLCKSLDEVSISVPTEIQIQCIPAVLNGRNVIASAKTGSGKTLAFVLPIVQNLAKDPYGIFAVILTPTRELAFQIAEQARATSSSFNSRLLVIVGGLGLRLTGADLVEQAEELGKRPHIVIATPGRLAELITNNGSSVRLNHLRYFVIDEADKLLGSTFDQDFKSILSKLPRKKPQMLLFSATMSEKMKELSMGKSAPLLIECCHRYDTVSTLEQKYMLMNAKVRDVYLFWVLKTQFAGNSAIIFASKCRTCEYLRVVLRELGIDSTTLHSQMKQSERMASLARFKGSLVKILITTDIGSRGLDIPAVDVVLNYQLPLDSIDYIHRVGRTARAGLKGVTVSLVSQYDIEIFLEIENKIGKKIPKLDSDESQILKLLHEVSLAKRISNTYLSDTQSDEKAKQRKKLKVGDLKGVEGGKGKKEMSRCLGKKSEKRCRLVTPLENSADTGNRA